MSIKLTKLSDLRNFYQNVPYYVNKGGRDGMAELIQHYKTLSKMYKIRIPKIANLLQAHGDIKCPESATPKRIKHLEQATILLATKRSRQLTAQISKIKSTSLFAPEEKMEPKRFKKTVEHLKEGIPRYT